MTESIEDDSAQTGERSAVEQDFLIKQSIVGELEEFFPDEFLDRVKARFQARLAERAQTPGGTTGVEDHAHDG